MLHSLLQGNLPNPGIELTSPAQAGRFFTAEPPGKPDAPSSDILVKVGERPVCTVQVSLVAQTVKKKKKIHLPMQKTQVQSLGWEGNPLQYARLENSMNSGVWQATAHGVAKSRTSK